MLNKCYLWGLFWEIVSKTWSILWDKELIFFFEITLNKICSFWIWQPCFSLPFRIKKKFSVIKSSMESICSNFFGLKSAIKLEKGKYFAKNSQETMRLNFFHICKKIFLSNGKFYYEFAIKPSFVRNVWSVRYVSKRLSLFKLFGLIQNHKYKVIALIVDP